MMDVVYVVGAGSRWEDNELRYSLRSLARHVSGVRHVYVVGHRPAWCSARHIEAGDPHVNKDANIIAKTILACGIPGLSPKFLYHQDDHFWLRDVAIGSIPAWHCGKLASASRNAEYVLRVRNTSRLLAGLGLEPRHFDLHTPMLVDRRLFPEAFRFVDWVGRPGVTLKSWYANMLGLRGVYLRDLKVSGERWTRDRLTRALRGRPVYSTGDRVPHAVRALLAERFPHPSPWES